MNPNVEVFQIRKRIKNPNEIKGNHIHNFFQFIFVLSGKGAIKLKSSDQIIQTSPSDLFLIPPFMEHEILGYKDLATINISFFCADKEANRLLAGKFYRRTLGNYETAIVQDVLNESVTAPCYNADIINIRINELVVRTLRDDFLKNHQNISPEVEISSLNLSHEMQFVLNYIDENISLPLTISQLSKLFGYSESYFSICFKKAVGCAPGKYVVIRKLQIAKEMLLTTRLNITQISERLGFESIHYFSRVFKNFYGVSPKKFLGTQKAEFVFNLKHKLKYIPAEFDPASTLNTWSES